MASEEAKEALNQAASWEIGFGEVSLADFVWVGL